jgi:uroporphyrin-III C-methyltransferase
VTGMVHLVGAGPGAADLLTLRAARLLGEADIVFHDALVPAQILALAPQAEKILVGKRSGRYATGQSFINKQLADAAGRFRTVVRLKGGDPMLFGRAHEELEFLAARGITVRVVPGVTAAMAASAELGISLTRRGEARSVTFVTPRVGEGTRESSWIRAVLAADTAAIYMGAGEGDAIAAALLGAGKSPLTPVAVVESASMPDSAVTYTTLGALGRAQGEGPMLILMGDVFGEAVAAAIADGRRYRPTYAAAGASLGGTGLFRRKPSQSA